MSTDLIVSGETWGALKEQCLMLVRSGFLPSAIKTPEQALAIALKGRELNLPPMQSFSQINVIQGKPAVSAELQMALIYRNVPGAKIEFTKLAADGCSVVATRPGHKPVEISFDKADAEAAGLLGKDNWKKYARAMYRSRAISEMARSVFPDAIMGCSYTPEEMGAMVNGDGEVVDIAPAHHHHVEESADKPKPMGVPYTGLDSQQTAMKELLLKRGISEDRWETVHHAMIGKTFTFATLDMVLKETSQGNDP
jgi:hypothetical protein